MRVDKVIEFRNRLERRIGQVTPEQWALLEAKGYAGEAAEGADLDELVDQVVAWERFFAGRAQRHLPGTGELPVRGPNVPERARALSGWAVLLAERHPQVRRWRAAHPLVSEAEAVAAVRSGTVDPDAQQLAGELADRYSWHPEEAVVWLLCGRAPRVRLAWWGYRYRYEVHEDMYECDAFTRVVLSLDPALTPDQVAAVWAEVRRRVSPGRVRPQQRRAVRLAEHMAGFWDEDHTWADAWEAWNQRSGDPIDQQATFRTLAREAVRRLLRTGWRPATNLR